MSEHTFIQRGTSSRPSGPSLLKSDHLRAYICNHVLYSGRELGEISENELMYGNTHRWLVRDANPEGLGGLDPLKICIGGVIVCFDPFYPVSEMTYTVSSGTLNSTIPLFHSKLLHIIND